MGHSPNLRMIVPCHLRSPNIIITISLTLSSLYLENYMRGLVVIHYPRGNDRDEKWLR